MFFSKKRLFNDYAENIYFKEAKKTVKTSSYFNFLYLYQKYIKDYWCGFDIKKIDSKKVQDYYEYLSTLKNKNGENLSKSTINRGILGLFRTILNHAAIHGEIQPLLLRLKTPNNLKKENKTKIMAEKELEKLKSILKQPLSGAKYRNAKIFTILALYQGLRIGEICGLKWEDVDFKNKTISIKRTVNNVYDCEKKDSKLNISTPKTESSERIIPMLDFVAKKMSECFEICYQNAKMTYCDMKEFNKFYILAGKKPTTPRVVRSGFERLLAAYDIPYVKPHSLRHSFCTESINAGCATEAVSQILGHSNSAITLNVYNHLTSKKINDTIEILNRECANA